MPGNDQLKLGYTSEVRDLYQGVVRVLNTLCEDGRKVGDCRFGVYLFLDYDGEPIYVGQSAEKIRVRIRRHLTNQRTDAVAMKVLDPFEVDEIEMWPFWDFHDKYHAPGAAKGDINKEAKIVLDRAEFTVYNQALIGSTFGVVLNEKPVVADQEIKLPKSVKRQILPDDVRTERNHPDVRIARRARTIAGLAAVISERQVERGIRHTFLAQAQRLESLASARLEALGGQPPTTTSSDTEAEEESREEGSSQDE